MDFFEKVGKRLTNAGQNVAQQTQNFADVTRLNNAISEKEKKISRLYSVMGRAYYEGHQDDPTAEYAEMIAEVNNLQAEIAKLQEEVQEIKALTPVVEENQSKNRKVGIIAIAAAAVVVIGLLFALLGGRSEKATIKKYINGTFDGNAKALISVVPDKALKVALEDEDMTKKELIEELDEELEYVQESLDRYMGEGWKVTYKIKEIKKIKGDDLEEIQDDYKDEYKVKVSAAKVAKVELTIKTKDGDKETSDMKIYLVKIGRSWYIDIMNMSLIGY